MIESETEKIAILRLTGNELHDVEDVVVREFPLTIIFNNQELVTLLCSPANLDYLAIGFLFSEGLLKNKDEIRKVTVDQQRGIARVEVDDNLDLDRDVLFKRLITSGCGRGAAFYNASDATNQRVESRMQIATAGVLALVRDFQHHSVTYRATGGVHSAALCDSNSIIVFSEDIGRHNAIDKIFGQCLLSDMPTDEKLVITSGRISSEILLKVARRNIPIIISKSAPTDLGIQLANDLGITLVGFVRGKRMNVYTNNWRIVNSG